MTRMPNAGNTECHYEFEGLSQNSVMVRHGVFEMATSVPLKLLRRTRRAWGNL